MRALLVLGLCAAGVPADAQEPPLRDLGPGVTVAEGFTEITSVRALRDGHVIVLDGGEQSLALIDPKLKSRRSLGTRGRGPGEIQRATWLLALGGDSTLVADAGNGRLLVVLPGGAVGGVITPGDRASPLWLGSGSDERGFVYAALASGAPGGAPSMEKAPDSLVLMRMPLFRGAAAPIATLAAPPTRIVPQRSGDAGGGVNVVRPAFAVGDQFAVAPDGRVAIVRKEPYRVELLVPDGGRVRGPDIRVPTLTVGEAEKELHLQGLAPAARASATSLEWPAVLPPFPPRAAMALRNGETWVRRHTAASSLSGQTDVFDRHGVRIARIALPRSQRIVSVSAAGTWVADVDADGLQSLVLFPGFKDDGST